MATRTHLRDESTDQALCAGEASDHELVDDLADAPTGTPLVAGWELPPLVVAPARTVELKAVPATVYAKRKRHNGRMLPVARIALYRPATPPSWPKPWTVEELAAMGKTGEHSEAWKAWYKAMPAKMTAKQERAYFLKGGA